MLFLSQSLDVACKHFCPETSQVAFLSAELLSLVTQEALEHFLFLDGLSRVKSLSRTVCSR